MDSVASLLEKLSGWLIKLRMPFRLPKVPVALPSAKATNTIWIALVVAISLYIGSMLIHYMAQYLSMDDVTEAAELGSFTLLRVLVLIALASIVWVPIGVWIGMRPKIAERIQPIAQFLAAFPANLLFPVAVVGIVRFHLQPDIWLSPLIILGTQWYILFQRHRLQAPAAFPGDLKEVAANFHLHGKQWWTKVILPGIFPYYITRRHHRIGRVVERQHRRRGRKRWGHTTLDGARHRVLHRSRHRQRRLSAHRAGHQRHVGVCALA